MLYTHSLCGFYGPPTYLISPHRSSHHRTGTPTFRRSFPYVTARRRAIVPNLPDPDLMTPDARRAEVAAILATGFLRLRLKQTKKREIPLDVLPRPSDECSNPSPREREG